MSLATRCTACGTVFRIVEDQLRVSDGWVRCGRCAEIFDARELLFDIESEAPPPWPAPAMTAPEEAVEPPPEPAPPPPAPLPVEEPMWAPPPEAAPLPEAAPSDWHPQETRLEPRWVDEAPAAVEPEPEPEPATEALLAAEPAAEAAAPTRTAMPEFMRRAESSARWNRPAVRIALALLSLLLLLLLALQAALHFRDALAALHPPLRAPLQSLCSSFGCELRPWRRIDALSIDATSLNPIGSGSYRLNLALRNKTGVDVAAPSIELSLTDASGAPFARRVLGPEALSPALKQVAAESEQALSLSFSTGGQRVSGYSVNIFYP